MNRQSCWNVSKYVVGVGLLAWVVQRNWYPPAGRDTGGIADALSHPLQLTPLLAALLLMVIGVLLTFARWYVLVRAQGLPFTLSNAIRLGFVGHFWSTFMPGSIGGDIFKAVYIAREQNRRTVAVATVLVDRVVGLWGLFALVVVVGGAFWLAGNSALDHRSLQWVVAISALVVLGTLSCWLVMGALAPAKAGRFGDALERLPKVGHAAAECWRAAWMYRCQGKSVALAVALAMLGHVGFVLTFFFSVHVFLLPDQAGRTPSLEQSFILVPIGMTWQAIFPTPGGVGGGEYGFGALYALIGKSCELGVLASLVARMINWLIAIVGIVIYARMKPPSQAHACSADAIPSEHKLPRESKRAA